MRYTMWLGCRASSRCAEGLFAAAVHVCERPVRRVLRRSFPQIGRHCHCRRLRDDVGALELVRRWRLHRRSRLAAAIFAAIGLGVAFSGRSIAGLLPCGRSCPCDSGYFHVTDLVYGFIAAFVILFLTLSGIGMGTGDGSAACQPVEGCYRIGWRMDAAAASASAGLAVLFCRRFHGYWSVNAGHCFRLPAAKSTRFDAFRLKS